MRKPKPVTPRDVIASEFDLIDRDVLAEKLGINLPEGLGGPDANAEATCTLGGAS